jgi:hypothetical protein
MNENTPACELRKDAVNEVCAEHKGVTSNTENFIKLVAQKFIEKRLQNFPRLCSEARRVNYLKIKQLSAMGNEKGWSEKKNFMFTYIIPRDLYVFMTNLVYRNFWDEENSKVWRPFMRGIVKGEAPEALLRKVKVYYGKLANG